jgi:hypothetical protein
MKFNGVIPTEKRIERLQYEIPGGQQGKFKRYIRICQRDYILTYFIHFQFDLAK